MAKKPTRTNAIQPTNASKSQVSTDLKILHWTEQELRLPMWLRRNRFPKYVVDPVEQVFLTGKLPALFATLFAIVQLARGAEVNILRVRIDHETNPGSMDPPVFVQNVLFCLRTARDEVLSQVPAVHVSVASTRLDKLIDATRATLDAFMSEPVNKILCNKSDCNKGGKHLFLGPWVDATKRSGDAIEDVFRLSNLVGNSTPESDNTTPDPDFQPASWFGKTLAARIRMASGPKRKNKKVRKKKVRDVVCYSVSDARLWWAKDIAKREKI